MSSQGAAMFRGTQHLESRHLKAWSIQARPSRNIVFTGILLKPLQWRRSGNIIRDVMSVGFLCLCLCPRKFVRIVLKLGTEREPIK